MTSQLVQKKKKRESEKEESCFFCRASKRNIHKGNVFMPDIGRHNQSNTVAPKYMPGNPEPLAQQTVNHSDVAYNCGN